LIEGEKLIQKMVLFHRQVQVELSNKGHELSSEINIRNLIHWADLTREQQQRGISFTDAFHRAMQEVYLRNKKSQSEQNTIQNLYEKIFDFSNDTIELFLQDCILGISFFIAKILFSIHKTQTLIEIIVFISSIFSYTNDRLLFC
jgi:hypothetical protein